MQGGKVWEKAGVGVSVVYGAMPPEAYRAATGTDLKNLNGVRRPLPPGLLHHPRSGSCRGPPACSVEASVLGQ